MLFPIINISPQSWVDDCAVIIESPYFWRIDEDGFMQEYYYQYYCDSKGDIYQIIGKAPLKQKWRKWFRFFPLINQVRINFKKQNKRITIDELREIILKCLEAFEAKTIKDLGKDNEFVEGGQYLMEDVKTAKTYVEIISPKD